MDGVDGHHEGKRLPFAVNVRRGLYKGSYSRSFVRHLRRLNKRLGFLLCISQRLEAGRRQQENHCTAEMPECSQDERTIAGKNRPDKSKNLMGAHVAASS